MKLSSFLSTGVRRDLTGAWGLGVRTAAAIVAAAVIYSTVISYTDIYLLTSAFLAAMLTLVFIAYGATPASNPRRPTAVDLLLSVIAAAAGLHMLISAGRLATRIPLLSELTPADQAAAVVLLLTTLEATRRTVGPGLVAVVLVFVGYNLYGHLLPGKFGHGEIDFQHFIDLSVFTFDGLFGVPLRVAATYAFLFVLFGTVLAKAGGARFFFDLAATLSGRRVGGPAKIAVTSSALFGTLSGSPTSDVVTTGSVTIPIMKRLGYGPAFAGAVEVAASTGGSILPPVMGSAAFIMAEYTGIEYRDIAIAAIVPAILYYASIYLQVHLRSLNLGLRGLDPQEIPRLRAVLREGGLFLVPLLALVVSLLLGYSPTFVAIYGTLAVVAVAMVRRSTRLGLVRLFECLSETTLRMIPVAGACAAAGLVVGGLSMTGLSGKFADLVLSAAQGQDLIALAVAALVALLLGMGMPTPSAYILAAVLAGQSLATLGLDPLQANLFLLYFASLSAMTPPVAVAAFAAAAIADANPNRIAVQAVRLSLVAFLVPFAFVQGHGLLLHDSLPAIAFEAVTACLGVVALAFAAEGLPENRLPLLSRALLGLAGVCLLMPGLYSLLAAAGFLAVALVAAPGLLRQLYRGQTSSSMGTATARITSSRGRPRRQ